MEKDPEGTLKALADMGYKQIELMDTRQIEKLKPIADDLGLQVHSSFMLWTTLTGNWDLVPHEKDQTYSFDKILEESHNAELSHLVFGYLMKGERETLDQWKERCEQLNAAGMKAKEAGIQLCYLISEKQGIWFYRFFCIKEELVHPYKGLVLKK